MCCSGLQANSLTAISSGYFGGLPALQFLYVFAETHANTMFSRINKSRTAAHSASCVLFSDRGLTSNSITALESGAFSGLTSLLRVYAICCHFISPKIRSRWWMNGCRCTQSSSDQLRYASRGISHDVYDAEGLEGMRSQASERTHLPDAAC